MSAKSAAPSSKVTTIGSCSGASTAVERGEGGVEGDDRPWAASHSHLLLEAVDREVELEPEPRPTRW